MLEEDEANEELRSELENLADENEVEEPKSIEQSIVDELNAMNQHFSDDIEDEIPVEPEIRTPQEPLKSVDEMLEELESEEEWHSGESYDGELDLGDDPLSDDIDLASEEELPEIDTVTPSAELDSYPELDLDEELDEDVLNISETEQALSQALEAGNTASNDLDDDLLTDDELSFEDVLGTNLESKNDPFEADIESSEQITQEQPNVAIEEEIADSEDGFDKDAVLDSVTEDQVLEIQDSPAKEEALQEEVESAFEDELPADTIEDELEIEDFPEFDEEAALEAATEEQALEVQDTPAP
ncbi:hypothetical protein D9981_10795, partial [Pseudoalteromonas phenolica O-BC30]